MERQIKARLGAAGLVLAQQTDREAHEAISRLQSNAVVELINNAQLTAEARADIAQLVVAVKWAGRDGQHVLGVLTPSEPLPAKVRRRSQQIWCPMLFHYFTEPQWGTLESTTVEPDGKLDLILKTAASLGLRCPTEGSLKLICSLWVHCTHSPDALDQLGHVDKYTLLTYVKRSFDTYRRRLEDPRRYITELPGSTVEYCRAYRNLFDLHYKETNPIPCRIPLESLLALDQSYGCRGLPQCKRLTVQAQRQNQLVMFSTCSGKWPCTHAAAIATAVTAAFDPPHRARRPAVAASQVADHRV